MFACAHTDAKRRGDSTTNDELKKKTEEKVDDKHFNRKTVEVILPESIASMLYIILRFYIYTLLSKMRTGHSAFHPFRVQQIFFSSISHCFIRGISYAIVCRFYDPRMSVKWMDWK